MPSMEVYSILMLMPGDSLLSVPLAHYIRRMDTMMVSREEMRREGSLRCWD